MDYGSWFATQDANEPTSGVPFNLHIFWRNLEEISELSLMFDDCQSVTTFIELGRYSTVIVMPNIKKWTQISLFNTVSSLFLPISIFNRFDGTVILNIWKWIPFIFICLGKTNKLSSHLVPEKICVVFLFLYPFPTGWDLW